ncbi:CBS domain-containing protein [Haloplanus halobius]|uniref:CBS domain-containing protein n=1 Tax=Haloplanus halobius TaxID=2934938 RepID=UPI0024B0B090|nr:CBS domain-containing protein [Haloplanus sp. XH21]
MDISSIVSTEYTEVSSDTRIAKVVAAFEDPDCRGVIVTEDGTFEGVITRRQLVASHHDPDQKAGSCVWAVPQIATDEDVRRVAQLMIDGDTRLLPVFEDQHLQGVVTADDLLKHVQEFLEAATVDQAASRDLVTIRPDTTLGEALHEFRDHRITHLPVVEDGSARGMLTLYDIVDLTTREIQVSQGGNASGFDAHGGEGSSDNYRTHGGFGAREGELDRMLDLPVRDEMSSPVRTADLEETLDEVVHEMFDATASSLVVTDENEEPMGIITKTDVLDALTWGAEGHRAVQVTGTEYIDDTTYRDIVDTIDELDGMDSGLDIHDANIHINEHQERQRGTPLLFVRVRLATDRGLITASEEGYGASHALNEVRDILKRRIREKKTYDKSKKPPGEDYWKRRFGWLLRE